MGTSANCGKHGGILSLLNEFRFAAPLLVTLGFLHVTWITNSCFRPKPAAPDPSGDVGFLWRLRSCTIVVDTIRTRQ